MYYPNSNNFSLTELLPPEIIQRFGDRGLMLLTPMCLISLQQLRNRFGRMLANIPSRSMTQRTLRTVEFYYNREKPKGGNWEERALKAYAAYWGQHKLGNGMDITFLDTPLAEVIAYIESNPDEFPFITFIELDVTWLHFDCRNQPYLEFWSPKVVNGKTRGTVKTIDKTPIDWGKIVDIDGDTFKGVKK
jgi:hypothetical protein